MRHRALVIGNNSYRYMPPLAKCVNDAQAMDGLLDRKGYHVTLLEDADVASFTAQLDAFVDSLCPAATVVLHFSGHGCQVAGVNHLLFVDQSEADTGGDLRVVSFLFG